MSSSHQIGSWRVEDTASGFHPVDVPLKSADAPVKVVLDVTAVVPAAFDPNQIVLTHYRRDGGENRAGSTV